MGSSQMRQGTASRPSRRRTAALRLGTLQDHARTLLTAPCSARSRSPRQEGRPGVRARQETRPARRGSVEDVESAQPDQCQACAQACVASGRSVSAPRRVSCLRPKPPAFGRQSQPVRSCLAQPDGVLPWPQHPRCKCRWCRAPPKALRTKMPGHQRAHQLRGPSAGARQLATLMGPCAGGRSRDDAGGAAWEKAGSYLF